MTQTISMLVQIIFHFHDILRVELEKKLMRPYKKTKKQEREREKKSFAIHKVKEKTCISF
jgi:hypothetical protein